MPEETTAGLLMSDLKTRVQETTGLEVITLDSLNVAIRNAFADMTSRGYREFKEVILSDVDFSVLTPTKLVYELPGDVRKILRVKAKRSSGVDSVARISLANPAIDARVDHSSGEYCVDFTNIGSSSVYYIKNGVLYVEYPGGQPNITELNVQYYKKLTAPEWAKDIQDIDEIVIDIRTELFEALVFYCCYFYYLRFLKDPERIQQALSQYKYFMEDILYELNYEDSFNETDSVIQTGDFD